MQSNPSRLQLADFRQNVVSRIPNRKQMSILISNGLVIDGGACGAYKADILVEADKIAAITPPGGKISADKTIDAAGCLVTPGFVDCHSHSDAYLLIEPQAPSKVSQGITTEINGQCGGSAIPRYGEARLSSDWASLEYPHDGAWHKGPYWRSLAEYRGYFDSLHPAINTIQFIGHNTLRSSVMGYKAAFATPDEISAMKNLLARELDCGGWGLTTGLIYQPGKYSNPAEVEALAEVASARGRYYATHMRSEGDNILEAIDEVLALVEKTGIRAEISHLKTSGRRNWCKIDSVLEKIELAVFAGKLMGADRYPFCAAGTDLDVVLPDWAGEGGLVEELKRLNDPALRKRIAAEIDGSGRDWNDVMIGGAWTQSTKALSGKRISEIPGDSTAGEKITEILIADKGRTGAFFFSMCEENMRKILSRPWVLPGSDASLRAPWGQLGEDHPHPRAYSTMPQFYNELRKLGVSREDAVRRMTSLPCERFGIGNRGVLKKGAFADIAIWNENEFAGTAVFAAPHSFCKGMRHVIVNGCLSYSDGSFTQRGAGRFLSPCD